MIQWKALILCPCLHHVNHKCNLGWYGSYHSLWQRNKVFSSKQTSWLDHTAFCITLTWSWKKKWRCSSDFYLSLLSLSWSFIICISSPWKQICCQLREKFPENQVEPLKNPLCHWVLLWVLFYSSLHETRS